MKVTKLSLILAVSIFGLTLGSCIALKPNGHIKYSKQVYHDLTHRNNGYFNAEQRIDKVMLGMTNTRKDDYDKILPIYTDRDPALAKTYTSDLDAVIQKTSTVITNHRPSIYTPNSYLLVGESYFLKGDFDNAVITFQYVNTEFKHQVGAAKKPLSKAEKEKKKKKSKKHKGKPMTAAQQAEANANAAINGTAGKSTSSTSSGKGKRPMTSLQKKQMEEAQRVQDSINDVKQKEDEAAKKAVAKAKLALSGKDTNTQNAAAGLEENKGGEDFWHFIKHEPVRPDAMIWLANTYTEMKKYKESEAVLTIIDADEGFPSWEKKDVELARANNLLKREDFQRAIAPLSWLTEKTKHKHGKVRYEYILAQIYEKQKNSPEALKQYENVLDGHPNYVMAFHAKMSIARIAINDNSMPTADVVSLLKKLLNDPKNKEFYGQVYFALAELMLRDGNKKEAIGYYKKSISSSGGDAAQKAKAYLKLGELYFEDENYVASQPYYDSSLNLLQKDDPKRPEVSKRASILKNLVTQVKIIHDCDSLLKLSQMSDKQREQFVEDQMKKEEEEKEEQKKQQQFLLSQEKSNAPVDKNSFYFDNPDAKATGYNDFLKRWGERKLDDNWRRLDKSVSVSDTATKPEEDSATLAAKDSVGKQKLTELQKRLKNIPNDTAEIAKTNEKIIDAYYMLGTIYNIDLDNPPKAISTFEELLKRYPTNKWEGESYYNLYLLYAKQANQEKSEYYKNLVLTKFPDSQFANIIKDPNFLKRQNAANDTLNDFYASTYNYYLHGMYDSVIGRKAVADSLLKTNKKLKPKFDMMEAYAVGKTQDLRSYKEALQNIIKQYPSDTVHMLAQQILKYIETAKDSTIHLKNDMTRYEYSVEARHFLLIKVKVDTGIKAVEVVKALADYNNTNHSAEHLKVVPTKLSASTIIITVEGFDNLKKGKAYYDAVLASNLLSKFPKDDLGTYLISDVNLNKVVQNKEIESYLAYYSTKYVQQP